MERNPKSDQPGPYVTPVKHDDTWGTPDALFATLHAEHGFTVDADALPHNAKLPRFWSPAEDGLKQSWDGERVFCNPPWSNVGPWVAKALSLSRGKVVLLLPSRTDRQWFHDLAWVAKITFLRGRLRFKAPEGRKQGSAREGALLAVIQRD